MQTAGQLPLLPGGFWFLQYIEETMPSQAGKYAVPCRKTTPGSKPIPLALPSLWQKHSRGAFRLPGGLFLRLLGGSIICLTNR